MSGLRRGPAAMTATMFMLVVTFIVASTTAFAFTGIVDDAQSEGPITALDVDISENEITVTHERGDALDTTVAEFVITHDGETERISFSKLIPETTDDGVFTAGESVRLEYDQTLTTGTVRVVYDETVLVKRDLPTDR